MLWRRDVGLDLEELLRQGATNLVCLLLESDLHTLTIPNLLREATNRGLRVHWLPIPDGIVPPSHEDLDRLLATLRQRLSGDASVVIHCEGDKGRTGVVAGCLLVSLGVSVPEAMNRLHEARGPNCPENDRQRAFLARFAQDAWPWGDLSLSATIPAVPVTLWMLHGDEATLPPLRSLGEALADGQAMVRETEDYNRVLLDNHGDLPVLCLAGDLIGRLAR